MQYRSRFALVAVLAAVSVVGAACGDGASGSGDDVVEGIVSEVTGDLSNVASFVVLDDQGNSHLFTPEPGLLFYGGPLTHLRDHIVTGQKVKVTFEDSVYGEMTAVLIEHADGDSTHETPDDHSDHGDHGG